VFFSIVAEESNLQHSNRGAFRALIYVKDQHGCDERHMRFTRVPLKRLNSSVSTTRVSLTPHEHLRRDFCRSVSALCGGNQIRADVDLDPWIFSAGLGCRFNLEDVFGRRSASPPLK